MDMTIYHPGLGIDPAEASTRGEEFWVPFYEGPGFVSNMGRIANSVRELVEPTLNQTTGYQTVWWVATGRPQYVHVLVLASFSGPRPGHVVQRKEQNRTDNRLCNLFWSDSHGKLTKKEKDGVEEQLRQAVPSAEIARSAGISPQSVWYYKRAFERKKDAVVVNDFVVRRDSGPVVYLITDGDLYKIGYSESLLTRLRSIANACGRPVEVLNLIFGGCRKCERKLLREFADHRRLGEWFTPAPEILTRFQEEKEQGETEQQADYWSGVP